MPENPENAMAISPAEIRSIGIPRKGLGGSAKRSLARTPANMRIATVNPIAAVKPKVTDSRKL